MAPSYPGAIRTWSTKLGWRHIVWASHVNDLQEELDATQRILGLDPHISRDNPGGLTKTYATVNDRMTAHARGEAMPYYRAQVTEHEVLAEEWVTVPITGEAALQADPFHLAAPDGVTLNSSGMWMIEARTEWLATGFSGANKARRQLRILVDDVDVGLVHTTDEDARNSFTLHNAITWLEPLHAGTTLTVQVRTEVEPPEDDEEPTRPNPGRCWRRRDHDFRLIRCWNGSSWAPWTGQSTALSSSTPPSGPAAGELWIDTSGGSHTARVYSGGSWEVFTGMGDVGTVWDSPVAPEDPEPGRVWVDTGARADQIWYWWDGHWRPHRAHNCRDGSGNPVPTPPPSTPTEPDYGLRVNVALRLHQMRRIHEHHFPDTGAVRAPNDIIQEAGEQ